MWQVVDCVWNVMAHEQKPDFVFRRNGQVHLNRWGRQFIRLLAAEVCASVVAMLDTPCSEVVRSVLATHSIRQFPLHFPSLAPPCAITFQPDSTTTGWKAQQQEIGNTVDNCFINRDPGMFVRNKRCESIRLDHVTRNKHECKVHLGR